MTLSQGDILSTSKAEIDGAGSFGQALSTSDIQPNLANGYEKHPVHDRKKIVLAILLALMMVMSSFLAILSSINTTNSKAIALDAPGQESVVTRVYDMFNVTLGDWWSYRYANNVIRSTFPSAVEWHGTPAGNTYIYSDYRMNVTAKNTSKVNTSYDPMYVPTFNPVVRGGNITLDWRANYITHAEAVADYIPPISNWYDGWFWRWNGTVTMDRTAAKMVLNMTDSEFDNFTVWKASIFTLFKQKFSNWVQDQMNVVWAIKFAYQYEGNTLNESYDIQKVGNSIVFQIIDHLSWGAESLLGRWWSHSFMQFEGWPEDVYFTAQIGPQSSNFNLDMAVQYSLFAATGTRDDRTCWVFENTHADAVAGSYGSYVSEFNNYFSEYDWCKLIANSNYQNWHSYDYTPWAVNLTTDHHKMIIEWPDSTTIVGYRYNGTNDYNNTILGRVTPIWVEPLPSEFPSNVQVNSTSRMIELTGPLDMLAWSQTTSSIPELQENWTRVGHLPLGCPYVEFVVDNNVTQKPIAAFSLPLIVATRANITLDGSASWDLDGSIVSYDWDFGDGTPNGTGAVTVHAWASPGYYMVTLTVTDNSSLSGSLSKGLQVNDTLEPVAVITGDSTGDVGELMQFNGFGSYDPDGSIVSYLWEFSDGTNSTGLVAYHVSPDYCNYTVHLTVTDNLGAQSTASLLVIIGLGSPVAKIAMPEKATEGQNILLSGMMSYSPDGRPIFNYSWDYGDGYVGYGNETMHSWASFGNYIVTLSVRDDLGAWSRPACAVIEVLQAGAAAVSVSFEKHSLLPSEATTLTLAIVDASGNVVTDFTGAVSIVCNESIGVTIPSNYSFTLGDAGVHEFVDGASFSLEGSYNVSASVDSNSSIFGYDLATVCNRTVDIRIYDIFQLPLPDYWLRRFLWLNYDEGFRNTSPVVGIQRTPMVPTAGHLWTTYMMNVEARNIPEINMSSPTFAALFNPTTGLGTANISIDFHMMNSTEINAKAVDYGYVGKLAGWDGWEYFLTCNVTMNRSAAEQIINLPATWVTQGDVDTWWATNNITTKNLWNRLGYLGAEGGYLATVGRLDIKACEDDFNYGQGLWSSMFRLVYIDPEHVALSYWNVGFGYDALLSRFLYWGGIGSGANYPNGTPNGIIPFEPWYDNMSLKVNIDDDHANVTLYGGIVYGFRAWESDVAPAGTAVWRWETERLDYLVSTPGGLSEMDIYQPNRDPALDPTYLLRDPGSSLRGQPAGYDYVPAVVTLKPGESIVMEAPTSMAVGYRPKGMTGDPSDAGPALGGYYDSLRMLERFGNTTIHAIGTPAGTTSIDARSGDLKIVGPFNPTINPVSGYPWLPSEPAPRIELWVGPMETHAPCAVFTVSPAAGDITTVFYFDASYSCDVEDTTDQLQFRWDWTGDGFWDTGWSYNETAVQTYPVEGNYTVLLEVMDNSGLTNIAGRLVQVSLLPLSSQFTPPHDDYGRDTNSNGLFDYLIINVSVSIASADYYWIIGVLNCTGYSDMNYSFGYLTAGHHNIELPFRGPPIYSSGYSGVFSVDLAMLDTNFSLIDSDSFTTHWYNYTQFDVQSQFVPPFNDRGNDTNSNGLYDYLVIDVRVNITSAGWYEIDGFLYDNSWNFIDSDFPLFYLSAGLQYVEVRFIGAAIYSHGYSGVFLVDLYLYENGTYDDFEFYVTNSYNYTQFDSVYQPVHFVPPYSDYGEDLNSNGLYDNLVLNVTVNASVAGVYWISGDMYDSNWSYVSWSGNNFYLNTGAQTIQLRFPSGSIYNHGYNGSFFVNLQIYDGPTRVDNDTYITNAYTYDQFELPPNHFAPPHSDHGEDTDANGLFDFLVVNVSVYISSPGGYVLYGELYDSDWNIITLNLTGPVNLSAGQHTIELWFDGILIGNGNYNGTFFVDLYLYDYSLNLSDYDSYTTNPYNSGQFEGSNLSSHFVPPFSDYGEDANSNGLYEDLVVVAPVFIAVAGWYGVFGEIYDGVTLVNQSSEVSYFTPGLYMVELRFNGTKLFNHGHDGVYNVTLSLFDYGLGTYVDTGWHITNWYNYAEFEHFADLIPPTTGITMSGTLGANGWYVSTVTVTLSAKDFESGVDHTYYRVRVNGGSWSAWTTYAGTFPLTANGTIDIEYYSIDIAGNSESAHSTAIKIDRIGPTTTSNSYSYTLVLSASDNPGGSGVNSTWYRVWSGASWGAWTKYTGPISLGTTGNLAVQFHSIDNAGNSETDVTIPMPIVDSTNPVSHVTWSGTLGLNGWYVTQVDVILEATDDLSGVSSIHYRVDGGDWKVYSSAIQLTAGGVHKIEFYATDNYGNDEDIQTGSVKIDRAPPTSIAAINGSKVTIIGEDEENGSGVDKIYYRIDGSNWSVYVSPINVTAAGNHTIEYYSVDEAGNSEGIHTIVVSNGQGGTSGLPVDLLLILILVVIGLTLIVLFAWKKKGKEKQPTG